MPIPAEIFPGTEFKAYRRGEQWIAYPECGRGTERITVISIPKSGTWLIPEILGHFGYVTLPIHTGHLNQQDFRFLSIDKSRMAKRNQYGVTFPLPDFAQLIQPGQAIVGHPKWEPESEAAFSSWKKIFLERNLRDALVSHMRYELRREDDRVKHLNEVHTPKDQLLGYIKALPDPLRKLTAAVLPWRKVNGILKVRFESMLGVEGLESQHKVLESISLHCNGQKLDPSLYETILAKSFGTNTRTYSGSLTKWREWWSDEVEEWFNSGGLLELNRELGYE